MLTLIIYQKSHRRKPIRLGYAPLFRDTQADVPSGWCIQCGSEVFDHDRFQCPRCRETKGENSP